LIHYFLLALVIRAPCCVPAVPAVPAFGQLKHSVPKFMPARGVVFCVEMACLLGPTLGNRSVVGSNGGDVAFFLHFLFYCAAVRRQLFSSVVVLQERFL
jgi:hypothetical protein